MRTPEPNETVILELGTPTPGGLLGTPKTPRSIVVDNDRKGTIQFAAPLRQRGGGERDGPS